MKTFIFLCFISFLIFSCSQTDDPNNSKNASELATAETKSDKESTGKFVDTLVKQPKVASIDSAQKVQRKEVFYDTIPTIKIAYVIADSGLTFMEKPDKTSTKLGTFEFGTKVHIIEETNIPFEMNKNGKNIKGQWVRVKAKTHKDYEISWHEHFQFAGYVFNGLLVDSVKADFKKIPITELDSIYKPEIEKKLKLTFKPIKETDFLYYKKNYKNQLKMDSSVVTYRHKGQWFNGYSFILKTSKFQFKFKNMHGRGKNYQGKIKSLSLYSLNWIGDEIMGLTMLDSVTNIYYDIPLQGDYMVLGPLVSPKATKILFHTGEGTYDAVSSISLYKIDPLSGRINFRETYTYLSKDWFITEVIWINEKSFALKGSDVITFQQGDTPPESKILYRIATIIE